MARQERRGANRPATAEARPMAGALVANLSRVVLALVIGIVAYGSSLLYREIDKPLTNVTIGGNFTFLQTAELTKLVASEVDGGFLSVDLEHLSDVLRANPWVEEVRLSRQWPSMLKVEVVEQVPIARWGEKGFLNQLGEELLIANNSNLSALPVLRAEFGSSREMMEKYQLMAELLAPTGLKIIELRRDNLGVWFIETAPGVRLVVGRDQVSEKLRRFNRVWAEGLSQQLKNIKTIDLRYPTVSRLHGKTASPWQRRKTFKKKGKQALFRHDRELARKKYGYYT